MTDVRLSTEELGAMFRLLSLFSTTMAVNVPLNPSQIAALDYLAVALPRIAPLSDLDKNYTRSLRNKINLALGVTVTPLPPPLTPPPGQPG